MRLKYNRQPNILPGFRLSLAFTIFYLTLIVLIPLSTLVIETAAISFHQFLSAVTAPRVIHSYKISFGGAFIAAFINSLFGLMIAWVLVRYKFPGKRLVDAIIDLPFAIPTAVAGIALTAIYAPTGAIGKHLGFQVAYTPLGIIVAMVFVGLPFVVRTVQPVMQDMDREVEEGASSLGASRWQVFYLVIIPQLKPALLTGFALAFARALSEYGSIIFIAGNIPNISEITPILIVSKLEENDYAGATSLALVMLIFSFIILFIVNHLQKWDRRVV